MSPAIVRPVDAAGLVLLRQGPDGLEVLLGRRHARAGFLPDIYVFPGGRVEPTDALGPPLPLAPAVAADLARGGRRPPSALLRAITPTASHRRYHTRFFLADGVACQGDFKGDGELEDLSWRPLTEIGRLNLVDVTAFVLEEAVQRREQGLPPGAKPAPRLTYLGESMRIFRRA